MFSGCLLKMAFKESPDVESIIKKWAFLMFETTRTSRAQKELTIENLSMEINWKKVKFVHSAPDYSDILKPQEPQSQVLFKTFFVNNTDSIQEYSFKTERCTKSAADITVEKGLTIGEELSLSLKTPCEILEVGGGFHRELSVTNVMGQSFEEELAWGVDSQIKVQPRHKTTAELVVNEDQYESKFSVKSSFSGKIHVTILNLKDNNSFLKSVDGNIVEIMKREIENGLPGFNIENNEVTFISKGKCNFRYAIEQRIQLDEQALE